jgi:hypothetical protein
MKVKPVDPNAVIRDPQTRVQLPAEGCDVPDNVFWNRRLLAKEIVRIDNEAATATAQPVGNEPIAPLTTRS